MLEARSDYRIFHKTHVEYLRGHCAAGDCGCECEYDKPYGSPPDRYDYAGPAEDYRKRMLKNHPAFATPEPLDPSWGLVDPTWPPGGDPPVTSELPWYPCRPGGPGVIPVGGGEAPPYDEECEKGPIKSAVVYEYTQRWFVRMRRSRATGKVDRCEKCSGFSDGVIATKPEAAFVRDNYGPYKARKLTRDEACDLVLGQVASRPPKNFPNPVLLAFESF